MIHLYKHDPDSNGEQGTWIKNGIHYTLITVDKDEAAPYLNDDWFLSFEELEMHLALMSAHDKKPDFESWTTEKLLGYLNGFDVKLHNNWGRKTLIKKCVEMYYQRQSHQ